MNLESPKERMKAIEKQVEEALKDHRVTVVSDTRVSCWHCARPGTGIYGFYVMVIPGFVIVAGDIGEVIFQPTHPDPVDFIVQPNDVHYQLGKVSQEFRNQREVSPYLVREALSCLVGGYRGCKSPISKALKDLCREMRAEAYNPLNFYEFMDSLLAIEPDAALDFNFYVPDHGVVFRTYALRWFGRWLANQNEEKAA